MNWTKVTPETMPFVKDGAIFSGKLWVTIRDTLTDKKWVEMTRYVKATNIFDNSKMEWFMCEVVLMEDEFGGGHYERKPNIEVTYWAKVKYPEPADG